MAQEKTKFNMAALESTLELYFNKKAPSLPSNVKEIIVKYSPYLILISIICILPVFFGLLGLSTMLLPASFYGYGGVGYGAKFTISTLFSLISLVISVVALPGMFKRSEKSWRLIFYGSLVSFVSNLISFNLGSLIIGSAISWYVLFQVKSYYKN